MTRAFRILFWLILSLVILALAVVLLAWWLIDTDEIRERVETRLGEALAMDVQIGEPPRFGVLRGVSISLTDLEISKDGEVIAEAETVHVRLALSSLLSGNIRPAAVYLQSPTFSIERIGPGKFNIQLPATEGETLDKLSLRRVQLNDARLNYLDQASGLGWLFAQCNVDLRNIRHDAGQREEALATLSANGNLQCVSLTQDEFELSDLSVDIRANSGALELDPINATFFEGELSANLKADLSASPPEFTTNTSISQFDLAAFMEMLEPHPAATGTLDLELTLSAQGTSWQEVRNTTTGSINLTSGELVLEGLDLDDELDGYSDTQRFNLIDVGAVFLAGPVGLVASRGYTFTGMIDGGGGSTRIDQMVSKWVVEDGVAQVQDVAFRTQENRLALSGSLDFTDYQFNDLQVAVLDRDGCSVVKQRISGSFREPEVKQPNFLVTVAGPLLDLIERGVQAITDDDCEAFYTGTIAHP